MSEKSIFSNLVRQPDGAFSAVYGPYLLQSALQPIFHEREDGHLQIAAFKGLIRAGIGDLPSSPAEFFQAVPEEERAAVDGLCRSLHILNAGALGRPHAALIVGYHSGLYGTQAAMRQEEERLRLCAHEAGMPFEAIACEIREHPDDDPGAMAQFAARLHESGFSIAIDDYTGEDSDLERLERLDPQFVTFDTAWLRGFAENSAGLALLRVVVGQFAQKGIRAVVAGIEEPDMLDLCREMGGPLMQGYLLARPELAPTTFNIAFPFEGEEDAWTSAEALAAGLSPAAETRVVRPQRQFGRRGV
ncbi:EAL domain-containing protein [Shinella zoogloeoides]|uniref:EAL domain-containing protein n=1 Tax=Shinella zoogloeoides TaxID=352475 RepID=A0A6N8TE34_SHIZO|nr:EAL domain-containing protein [Shinella zoogloeoides]MXO01527.1 EAL domain-containing protein [Shinella zoogloeoides]UEX80234.1 EAL domain-containing protein [Shinella zoogloeoides]